jgi:hypothetical protein
VLDEVPLTELSSQSAYVLAASVIPPVLLGLLVLLLHSWQFTSSNNSSISLSKWSERMDSVRKTRNFGKYGWQYVIKIIIWKAEKIVSSVVGIASCLYS